MILNELKVGKPDRFNIQYHYKFKERFLNLGYKLYGSGTYGDVYSKDHLNYVYKSYISDSTYYKYISYCFNNPHESEHFPKVYKIFKFSDTFMGF